MNRTNICDLKCPMCPTGAGVTKSQKGFIDIAVVEKVASELKHRPGTFGLWLAGEPLLHPQIVEIVRICTDYGQQTSMHTNATRLTSEMAEELIRAGLYEISVSFDGRSVEEYETMRKGANFHKVLNNIKSLLETKRNLSSDLPRVVIQNIEPYEKGRHKRVPLFEGQNEIKKHFIGLQIDTFRTILAHSWSGTLEDSKFVAPGHRSGKRWVCNVPYTDLTINWKGEAVTCCGDLDGANILGDIKNENLYELWNNENFQQLRAAMHSKEIERFPLCKTCERIWADPHPNDYLLRLEIIRYKLKF